MARSIRAAAVQLQAHDTAHFSRYLDRTIDALLAASAQADLVVLPEGTFPGYVLGDTPFEHHSVDAALQRVRAIAAQTSTVVVIGAVVADPVLRNSAIVIDADGSVAGRADKLFLWHFDRNWFEAGQRIAPVPTAVGTLGVMICADGRLPTVARALVDSGAVALVMPTAWVTTGRDPNALENVQADLLARVRAFENNVPFIAANKCGAELGMVAYCGKSQIVDGDGKVLALASERAPESIAADLTLGEPAPHRTAIVPLAARPAAIDAPVRIAISFDPLPSDIDRRLAILDNAYALAPADTTRLALLDACIPSAFADDRIVLDPASLVAYRRSGYRLICWTTNLPAPWSESLARARALELRIYLIVFDRYAGRAFAVDPDGTIVAGTFEGYRLASFSLDPSKTTLTTVAPNTDIAEGLERVEAMLGPQSKSAT